MAPRIAVVSDAVSAAFFFPIWHRYYGNLFGEQNLFLITYAGLSDQFRGAKLGGLIELPVGYNDTDRAAYINSFIPSIMTLYDVVVRVDIDEFLVVDPRVSPNLADYIATLEAPYMTARGFDVTQLPDEPNLPETCTTGFLQWRSYATPNTALNKTCIVKTAVEWSEGFHFATVHPRHGPLFMLHMKRLDIGWQMAFYPKMMEQVKDNPRARDHIRSYYSPPESVVVKHHADVSVRPRFEGIDAWYRNDLIRTFMDSTEFHASNRLYFSKYGGEHVLCKIPDEWKALL
jgi:hypothetical protein